ncbi:SIR2 family protein [Alloprevotella tannerae]
MGNIPQRLKEAIENDELVLFIGSGLSWKLKNTEGALGGWKEMVSSMLSYLKDKEYITAEEQQSYDKLEPIKALQRLENKGIDREKVRDFLQDYFTLGKENEFPLQEKLYSLSTKIITTNYDLAFEKAIEKLDKEKAYKGQNKKLSKLLADPVFLFKLHGCIDDINSMVLFPSDYRKLYNSKGQDAALTLLVFKFLIFSKTFLFIGTGMDEHQIINFFEEIKEVRDSFNQEHYIITTDPLSIPTNFLTSIKINDYAEIPEIIDQLVNIKKEAEEKKNPEKKQLLEQLEASEKENEVLAKVLYKEKNKNKIQALYLKREANNRFLTGIKHHMAEEYLEASEEYKAATELNPKYSDAYYNWGNALVDLAKTKSRSEAEKLYKEAFKKYNEATKIKQNFPEAYNNWGCALDGLAVTKSGSEAEKLYKEAFEKYKLATTYKKDSPEAYNNWGCALDDLAVTKSGSEAEKLYKEAFEKYDLAITYKQNDHDAYYNWGNALVDLAKTKSGKEAEVLYKEAFEKFKKATQYKPDDNEAYNNWGNALKDLAQVKFDSEAEELYKEAFEKYKLATQHKQNNHKAYLNWGNALCQLAKTKSDNEAEELYKEAFEKYKLATTYKKDLHQAYNNWGIALSDLAKTKSGNEAEKLYKEAFGKYNETIKYGGDAYNLACLCAIRNQKAEALKYLEQTLSRNEYTVEFVEQDEDWKELRNDPDFQDLLSRYNKQ